MGQRQRLEMDYAGFSGFQHVEPWILARLSYTAEKAIA